MPVTARFSQHFYDQLGDQTAGELVDWFNQVDASYHRELREINDLNFARFEAKVDQRFVAFEAKMDQRFAAVDARIDALEVKMDQRFTAVDARIDTLEVRMDQRFAAFQLDMDRRFALFEATLERRLGEQSRWIVVTWLSLMIPMVGLWLRSG